jgi:hypothetical protein
VLPFEFNSGLFARDAEAAFGAGFAVGFATGFGAAFGARVSLVEDLFDFVDEDFVDFDFSAIVFSFEQLFDCIPHVRDIKITS